MGIETYMGKPSKKVVNRLVKKFGMAKADFVDEVVYEDDAFLAFTAENQLPMMLEPISGKLTRSTLESLFNGRVSEITDLKLPNSINEIDPDAFDGMTSLTALTFPRTTPVWEIQENTFKDCQNLKVLKLGNGITTIWDGAFQNAESLQFIGLPYSLTSIVGTALENTSSCLTEYSFILSESRTMMTTVDQIESESQFYDGTIEAQMDWISRHVEGVEVTKDDDGIYVVYATKPGDGVEHEASKEVIDEITASLPPLMSQNNAPSSNERILQAGILDDDDEEEYEYGWHLSYTTASTKTVTAGPRTAFQTSHVPPEDKDNPYAECTEVKCPIPVYGFGRAKYKVYKAERQRKNAPGKRINLIARPEVIKDMVKKLNDDEKRNAKEQAHRNALDDLAKAVISCERGVMGLPCDICGKQ